MGDPESDEKPRVVKQEDKVAGCIPACAVTVMTLHKNLWANEATIVVSMREARDAAAHELSGFEQLAVAAEGLQFPYEVVVREDAPPESDLRKAVNDGLLPLACIDHEKPAGQSDVVHCLVLLSYDATGQGTWSVLDPWPEAPDGPREISGPRFSEMWCEGFAILKPTDG